jgi:hypothetical protein
MTKKITILTTFCLSTLISFSQTKGKVLDFETSEPISFVNISIKDRNFGTTSNEKGEFIINENTENEFLVVSSIGYENALVEVAEKEIVIYLKPKTYEIKEVIVKPNKEKREIIVNSLRKKRSNHSFACNEYAWISAKQFDFKPEYKETPYISNIKILTNSRINNAMFNVRILSANEKGEPSEEIYYENIIAYAKRGKKTVNINLSDKRIKFPEKRIFIALEWLIIEKNEFRYSYTMKGSKKKYEGVSYEPKFSVFNEQGESETWIYTGGKWYSKSMSQNENEYLDLAIELTLTN